eukprot:4366100-Prorocentrum_lima.AAC.1
MAYYSNTYVNALRSGSSRSSFARGLTRGGLTSLGSIRPGRGRGSGRYPRRNRALIISACMACDAFWATDLDCKGRV